MADPTGSTQPDGPSSGHPRPEVGASPQAPAPKGVWERLKQHKVAQWTLAYAAAAYTLLHAVEMLSEAQEWPHAIARVLSLVLILGVPVVITLAWYHGARHARRVSGPELTIITTLLVLTGSVLWALTRTAQNQAADGPARPASAPAVVIASGELPVVAAAPRASIAVMPFVNLTGDTSKEYFSDGMAEELINLLAQVPGLKVPARTSSFAYKGRNIDIRHIARDLGVATILEGSVRSAGKRIRVTAQLVNAQTGYHMWSQDFDRQFTDIFKLQDDLAAAIAQALRMNMSVDLPAITTSTAPTQDVEAYQLYLQAGSVVTGSEQGFRRALALLDEALARDPKFARALADRAFFRTSFVSFGYPLPNALEDAQRDAKHALDLNPSLPSAHMALGTASALRGNWLQADASYRAAMALDPSDANIRASYAVTVLANVGQIRRWRTEAIEAYRLAPANAFVVYDRGFADEMAGRDEDAVKFLDLASQMGAALLGANTVLSMAALHQGRYADAAEERIKDMSPSVRSAGGAEVTRLVYSALADPEKKPTALQALHNLAQKLEPRTAGSLALQFTMLGALDPAYRYVNQALDESMRSGIVGDLWEGIWIADARPFRQDPRFQALVTRLGLIDYWKQHGPPDDCDLKDGRLTCR